MSKRKKVTLPRVTVLAYRRQDLVAFVQSVETLRLLVQDLRVVAEDLKKRQRRKAASPPPAANGEGGAS